MFPQIQRSTGNAHSAKFSGLDFKIPPFAADPRNTAAKMVELAKNPRKDMFPDINSRVMKNLYGMFPKTIMNMTSAGMRVMMKVKNGKPNPGNVLWPSPKPHRIYGETILPVPTRKTKLALLAGIGLGLSYMILKNSTSKK